MPEDYTAAIDAVFGPQAAPQPANDALPGEDYSAAIDSVFGPQAAPQQPSGQQALPDAVDTSGGITAALDAQPGMMEQQARQAFTPNVSSTTDQQPPVTPAEPEIDLADPTAGWYAPPTKQAPSPQPDD
ncbi:MAG: hypothetical protein IJU37_11825, partial [Desulfovibrio sp.]|nr:hypothetical protein [Desulfovibrio sp.]